MNNIKTSRVGLVHENGIMSSAYLRFSPKHKGVHSKYFYYWFFKLYQEEVYNKLGNGVRETLGKNELLNMEIPIPTIHEQIQIAKFLDWKISEIDKAISRENDKIIAYETLYKSKLNMIFDSVEGEKRKLRFIFKFGKGLNIKKENLGSEGNKCINYGDIHGKLRFSVDSRDDVLKRLSNIDGVVLSATALLSKDDFVFADTSEDIEGCGAFSFVSNDIELLYAGYHTIVCKPLLEVNSNFLAYQFESNKWRNQIRTAVNGVKVYSITQQVLKQSSVILPDLRLQQDIAQELDVFKEKLLRYTTLALREIEHLQELKQRLISEAVTGKIDVRQIKVPDIK